MGYLQALDKAWADIAAITAEKAFSVKLLSDIYEINLDRKVAVSSSCGVTAKDHVTIILLHYLAQKLTFKTLPEPSGEWIDFNELAGGEGYYPAFRKRTIDHIVKKYGRNPEGLAGATQRMPAKAAGFGDVSVIIYPFVEIGILFKISKADEEFGPDANILFDRNISKIFCTEDIVVLTEMIVHQL
jgi:hypothetical protein